MKIDILVNDGSPLQITERTVYGDSKQIGVGGAELALLTMCRAWSEAGHIVRLYNDPREHGVSKFEQLHRNLFQPQEERDYLIIFRSPNSMSYGACGKKIWWSCDQFSVGDFREFSKTVDKIVTISPRHAEYFKKHYDIQNTVTIDLAVRGYDYQQPTEKNMKQVIFCSVPDRGAEQLASIWGQITAAVPDVKLVITSDWRLWSKDCPSSLTNKYRLDFAQFDNVSYHGAISRAEMCKLQQQSAIHLYPCTYDELFCIAVAETQYAGCYPITTSKGSLKTTNMGFQSDYLSDLADMTIRLLQNPNQLIDAQQIVQFAARERFSLERILEQWNQNIFCG